MDCIVEYLGLEEVGGEKFVLIVLIVGIEDLVFV